MHASQKKWVLYNTTPQFFHRFLKDMQILVLPLTSSTHSLLTQNTNPPLPPTVYLLPTSSPSSPPPHSLPHPPSTRPILFPTTTSPYSLPPPISLLTFSPSTMTSGVNRPEKRGVGAFVCFPIKVGGYFQFL